MLCGRAQPQRSNQDARRAQSRTVRQAPMEQRDL
jgi:hypothetical protein